MKSDRDTKGIAPGYRKKEEVMGADQNESTTKKPPPSPCLDLWRLKGFPSESFSFIYFIGERMFS